MIEGCQDSRFTLKTFPNARVAVDCRRGDFDRNRTTQTRIVRAVDLAHASGTERSADLVGTEAGPHRDGHPLTT